MIREMSQDQYEHFVQENPGAESQSVYTEIEISLLVAKELALNFPDNTKNIFVRTLWKNGERRSIVFIACDGKDKFPIEILLRK